MKVKTRPVEAEAHKVTDENMHKLAKWAGGKVRNLNPLSLYNADRFVIEKDNGIEAFRASVGDWIIKSGRDVSVCDEAEFRERYADADDASLKMGANASLLYCRVKPQTLFEVADWVPGAQIVSHNSRGGVLPPSERGIRFTDKDGNRAVAIVGDWIVCRGSGEYSRENHIDMLRRYDVDDDPELNAMLSARDLFVNQTATTEIYTLVLACLQACKKIDREGKIDRKPIREYLEIARFWYANKPDGQVVPAVNVLRRCDTLRDLFIARIDAIRSVQNAQQGSDTSYLNWYLLNAEERARWLYRASQPGKTIDTPDEHDLAFLKNYDLAASLVKPGVRIGSYTLREYKPQTDRWAALTRTGGHDEIPNGHAHEYILSYACSEAQRQFVSNSPLDEDGAHAQFALLSALETEKLIYDQLKNFNQNKPKADLRHVSRPRG